MPPNVEPGVGMFVHITPSSVRTLEAHERVPRFADVARVTV
jgi:hypothetical protein